MTVQSVNPLVTVQPSVITNVDSFTGYIVLVPTCQRDLHGTPVSVFSGDILKVPQESGRIGGEKDCNNTAS